jgi:hypothetical protein
MEFILCKVLDASWLVYCSLCLHGLLCGFAIQTTKMILMPNNSPEPTPITRSVPHSRLTVTAARLSFCR